MPKKTFDTPTLKEATQQYLDLRRQPARQSDFDRVERAFQQALQRVRTVEDIRSALKLDRHRVLPVQLKSPAYERILSISGRTPALLREYSQEMYEYGPEWKHYADMLWDEANQIEQES